MLYKSMDLTYGPLPKLQFIYFVRQIWVYFYCNGMQAAWNNFAYGQILVLFIQKYFEVKYLCVVQQIKFLCWNIKFSDTFFCWLHTKQSKSKEDFACHHYFYSYFLAFFHSIMTHSHIFNYKIWFICLWYFKSENQDWMAPSIERI